MSGVVERGHLAIVGLGPGAAEHRTPAATAAVRDATVVVGYGPYIDLVAEELGEAQTVVRGVMGEEAARADEALDRAVAGARVALVSSGDAGVYGMAARTLERAAALPEAGRPTVEVIPGVTAALIGAARLGAPLADDWASLSLSDLHLPWATVERRLVLVAQAGLALALYNPRSKRRTEQFDRVIELLRAARGDVTAVGVVTDAGRPAERIERTTLGELDSESVGMRTLLLVAGESGGLAGPWMVGVRAAEGSA